MRHLREAGYLRGLLNSADGGRGGGRLRWAVVATGGLGCEMASERVEVGEAVPDSAP